MITVSIVSHSQRTLVEQLLCDLVSCSQIDAIVLTHNLPEAECAIPAGLQERVRIIRNTQPKGFAANHNAAFEQCLTPFFAILNPDLRLPQDPFPALLNCLTASDAALVAPAVVNTGGGVEDSARIFPTPAGLLLKAAGVSDGRIAYRLGEPPVRPDWVAGMFMLVECESFRRVGGFDAGFHLYYEDVDLCARLRKSGGEVLLCPATHVIHDARRASRRRLRYLMWHVSSMARFFFKHLGRLPRAH